jgi:hypothetical protein
MQWTDLDGIHYIGGDVVSEIIRRNQEAYAGAARQFLRLDMRRDSLPSVDMILCRDGLVHLSFTDISLALTAVRESRSKYLLATTFEGHCHNEDTETGGWRPLNLQKPPFMFPKPVSSIWDGPLPDGTYADKALALYLIEDLPDRLHLMT